MLAYPALFGFLLVMYLVHIGVMLGAWKALKLPLPEVLVAGPGHFISVCLHTMYQYPYTLACSPLAWPLVSFSALKLCRFADSDEYTPPRCHL